MGPRLVRSHDGSGDAKQRLEIILDTLAGRRTIEDAAERLGISVARFHQIRQQALQGALSACEAKAPGRVAAPTTPETQRVAELKAENEELRFELRVAQTRAELALVQPEVLRHEPKTLKKTTFTTGAPRPSVPDRGSNGALNDICES
jgi:transposase-like protein